MIKVKLKNKISDLWTFGECWALPKTSRPFEMLADLTDGRSLLTTSTIVSSERTADGFSFLTKNSAYLLVILTDSEESCSKKTSRGEAGVSA